MKKFTKISAVCVVVSMVFLVALSSSTAFAQTSNPNSTSNSGCGSSGAGAATPSGYLPNPLCVSSVSDILYLAVDIATYLGVILAVIFIIYAGFKYIAARGNPTKSTEAHHFLLAVIIGIAILLAATAIINVIKTTLTSAGVVNTNTFNTPGTN
jgi:hypothetical protein